MDVISGEITERYDLSSEMNLEISISLESTVPPRMVFGANKTIYIHFTRSASKAAMLLVIK